MIAYQSVRVRPGHRGSPPCTLAVGPVQKPLRRRRRQRGLFRSGRYRRSIALHECRGPGAATVIMESGTAAVPTVWPGTGRGPRDGERSVPNRVAAVLPASWALMTVRARSLSASPPRSGWAPLFPSRSDPGLHPAPKQDRVKT